MGKTSLMLCWLWALAGDIRRCATDPGASRRVPLRYVVVDDRRVVVNDTIAAALRLADMMRSGTSVQSDAVAAVARTVRAWVDDDDEALLEVRELRGGMPIKPENVRHPAAPAIIVGTVDLVGSRLLWRGYGVAGQGP